MPRCRDCLYFVCVRRDGDPWCALHERPVSADEPACPAYEPRARRCSECRYFERISYDPVKGRWAAGRCRLHGCAVRAKDYACPFFEPET